MSACGVVGRPYCYDLGAASGRDRDPAGSGKLTATRNYKSRNLGVLGRTVLILENAVLLSLK